MPKPSRKPTRRINSEVSRRSSNKKDDSLYKVKYQPVDSEEDLDFIQSLEEDFDISPGDIQHL